MLTGEASHSRHINIEVAQSNLEQVQFAKYLGLIFLTIWIGVSKSKIFLHKLHFFFTSSQALTDTKEADIVCVSQAGLCSPSLESINLF